MASHSPCWPLCLLPLFFLLLIKNTMHAATLLAALVLALTPLTAALSDYDALQVVHTLAESFLSPRNIEVAKSINSTLFTEDVKGTLDLSTNFDGQELSTEYLFGLFVNSDAKGKPTPWGTPVAYNVTHLIVQNDVISASIKYTFHWPTIDKYWPIQIDSFLRVTDNMQISAYDVSFRRWAWATEQFMPALIPQMAESVGMPSNNATDVALRYFAQEICATERDNCHGADQQYKSHDACMDHLLNKIPLGEFHLLGGDNVLCRMLHVPMLPFRPSVHCSHVGPSGGDMCIEREYTEVVTESHFPEGWLAPKQVTTENAYIVGDTTFTNGTEISPLLEISMSKTNSWDPTWYATSTLVLFLIFYTMASGIWYFMFRYSRMFPTLSLDHQKNVVVYFLHTFMMTAALGLQLRCLPMLKEEYSLTALRALRSSGMIVSAAYLFEMMYRLRMRLPLLAHHFLTVFAMSFTVTMAEYTKAPDFIASATIWLFQATTEQVVFLGLAGYRLGWPQTLVSRMLKVGAVVTLVIKSGSALGLLVWWGFRQNRTDHAIDIAWTVILWLTAIGLMITQVWGSWVTYTIGLKVDRRGELPTSAHPNNSTLSMYASTPQMTDKGSPIMSPEEQSTATLSYRPPSIRAPTIRPPSMPRASTASSRNGDVMCTATSSPIDDISEQAAQEKVDEKK